MLSYLLRARNVYGASLAIGITAAFGIPSDSNEASASVWNGLLPSTGVELVLLMNPANCQVGAREIEAWNALHAKSQLRIRAVFLKPPARSERRVIEEAFNFDFPIIYDDQDAWSSALQSSGMPAGAALISRDGWVAGASSLNDWKHLIGDGSE